MVPLSLDGRTVVVTGASRGLGQAIAIACGRADALVYVGYRKRDDAAAATVAAIEQAGGRARCLAIDVTDRGAVRSAFDTVLREAGSIDVLVNNAGIVADGFFATLGEAEFDRVIDVDLHGTVNACREVIRPMMRAGRGNILNVASIAGVRASPGQTSYSAAKAGVIGFSRTLAVEVAARGIRVNCLVPGLIDTGMTSRMDRRRTDQTRELIPLHRLGRAEEAANVALFLVSELSSYVVGQAIAVDGGLAP